MKAIGLGLLLLSSVALADGVGLQGGLNFAMPSTAAGIFGTPVTGTRANTAPSFGAFYAWKLGDSLALQGELNVRGGDVGVRYLTLPLLARLTFELGGPVKPFILGGPQLAFKVAGTGVK